jgi:hypothetical protein
MDLMTTKEAAEQWGITIRRVQCLCEQGLIDCATRLGDIWVMPKATQKPIDGRTKAAKQMKKLDSVRSVKI